MNARRILTYGIGILLALTSICVSVSVFSDTAQATTSGGRIELNFNFSEPVKNDAGKTVGQSSHSFNAGPAQVLEGTGAGRADLVYSSDLTIAGSGSSTIDLASLTNRSGTAIAFAKVTSVVIYNSSNSIIDVGANGTNPWIGFLKDATDIITIQPKGYVMFYNDTGYAVGSSNKVLKLANLGTTSAAVQVRLLGRSS